MSHATLICLSLRSRNGRSSSRAWSGCHFRRRVLTSSLSTSSRVSGLAPRTCSASLRVLGNRSKCIDMADVPVAQGRDPRDARVAVSFLATIFESGLSSPRRSNQIAKMRKVAIRPNQSLLGVASGSSNLWLVLLGSWITVISSSGVDASSLSSAVGNLDRDTDSLSSTTLASELVLLLASDFVETTEDLFAIGVDDVSRVCVAPPCD